MRLRRTWAGALGGLVVTGLAAQPLAAQGRVESPADGGSGTRTFLRDVAHDYRNFLTTDTVTWLGGGLGVALATHVADDWADTEEPQAWVASNMPGGQQYGQVALQIPVAIGWWTIGHLAGSPRDADAGRDLLRAQISAVSWTYAFKYAVDRTRPNGDPRSFPSGHASSTFATAMVLQEHYGWKLGVPAFAMASYTATSRIADHKHWASDVVFGAFLGATSGRTVTLRLRRARLAMVPTAVPGGAALIVHASEVR